MNRISTVTQNTMFLLPIFDKIQLTEWAYVLSWGEYLRMEVFLLPFLLLLYPKTKCPLSNHNQFPKNQDYFYLSWNLKNIKNCLLLRRRLTLIMILCKQTYAYNLQHNSFQWNFLHFVNSKQAMRYNLQSISISYYNLCQTIYVSCQV